jgi:hypothetical protein
MSITVELPTALEQQLMDDAARAGQTVEDYVRAILMRQPGAAEAVSPSRQPLTAEEFQRLLDELSEPASLPELPDDFSRADIYSDHD